MKNSLIVLSGLQYRENNFLQRIPVTAQNVLQYEK